MESIGLLLMNPSHLDPISIPRKPHHHRCLFVVAQVYYAQRECAFGDCLVILETAVIWKTGCLEQNKIPIYIYNYICIYMYVKSYIMFLHRKLCFNNFYMLRYNIPPVRSRAPWPSILSFLGDILKPRKER